MVPYLIKTGSVVRVSQLAQFNLPGFVCISVTKRGHILLSKPSWLNPHAVTTVKTILLFKVKKIPAWPTRRIKCSSWKGSLPLHWDNRALLFSNIWLKQALKSLAERELQTSMMYDQTGSRIFLNNELSALEEIQFEQTLKSRSVKSFLIWRLDKYGRNKCVEISRKASTVHE